MNVERQPQPGADFVAVVPVQDRQLALAGPHHQRVAGTAVLDNVLFKLPPFLCGQRRDQRGELGVDQDVFKNLRHVISP